MNFDFIQMILTPKGRYRAFVALVGAYLSEHTLYAIDYRWRNMTLHTFSASGVEAVMMHKRPVELNWNITSHFVDSEGWNWFVVFVDHKLSYSLVREDYQIEGPSEQTYIPILDGRATIGTHICACAADDGRSVYVVYGSHSIKTTSLMITLSTREIKKDVWEHDIRIRYEPQCVEIDTGVILIMNCGVAADQFVTLKAGRGILCHACFPRIKRSTTGVVRIGKGRALFSVRYSLDQEGTYLASWDMTDDKKLIYHKVCNATLRDNKIATLDQNRVLVYGGYYYDGGVAISGYNRNYYIFNHATNAVVVVEGARSFIDDCLFYKPRHRWYNYERPFECAACGAQAMKMKMCARCKGAYYCNEFCQRRHWRAHRVTCNKK